MVMAGLTVCGRTPTGLAEASTTAPWNRLSSEVTAMGRRVGIPDDVLELTLAQVQVRVRHWRVGRVPVVRVRADRQGRDLVVAIELQHVGDGGPDGQEPAALGRVPQDPLSGLPAAGHSAAP